MFYFKNIRYQFYFIIYFILFINVFFFFRTTYASQTIQLSSNKSIPIVIKPEITSSIPFLVDGSPLLIDIISPSDSLSITLINPDQQQITEDNINEHKGLYNLDNVDSFNGFIFNSAFFKGFHYDYYFETPITGAWDIVIKGNNILNNEVVLVNIFVHNKLKIGIFTDKSQYLLNSPVLLIVSIFEDSKPIQNYTVNAIVKNTLNNEEFTVQLNDAGTESDNKSNDGLYSGHFIPKSIGDYSILAQINNARKREKGISDEIVTSISVHNSLALFNGSFNDIAIDTDENGLFEYIDMQFGIDILESGTYQILITLKGSNNVEKDISSIFELNKQIDQIITLKCEKEDVLSIGIDGPYQISSAIIEKFEIDKWIIMDEKRGEWETKAFQLSQVDNKSISLASNTIEDFGVDTNNNGLYEILDINFRVNIERNGFYQWSAKLVDSLNTEIEFANNSNGLTVGVNAINICFNGNKISENAVNGPYSIKSFLIFSEDHSLIVEDLGNTKFYDYKSFEMKSGIELSVIEGETVELDAQAFSEEMIISSCEWTQLLGQNVALSEYQKITTTFVAPAISEDSPVTLVFNLLYYSNNYQSGNKNLSIVIRDNGIIGFPDDVITFKTFDGSRNIGINVIDGDIVYLKSIDPNLITDTTNKPKTFEFGLINYKIRCNNTSNPKAIIHFQSEVNNKYKLYNYCEEDGWSHDNNLTIDDKVVTIELFDGGIGDNDKTQNGVIVGNSGLTKIEEDVHKEDEDNGPCFISITRSSIRGYQQILQIAARTLLDIIFNFKY